MKVKRGEALFGTGKEDSGARERERERETAIAQYFDVLLLFARDRFDFCFLLF